MCQQPGAFEPELRACECAMCVIDDCVVRYQCVEPALCSVGQAAQEAAMCVALLPIQHVPRTCVCVCVCECVCARARGGSVPGPVACSEGACTSGGRGVSVQLCTTHTVSSTTA